MNKTLPQPLKHQTWIHHCWVWFQKESVFCGFSLWFQSKFCSDRRMDGAGSYGFPLQLSALWATWQSSFSWSQCLCFTSLLLRPDSLPARCLLDPSFQFWSKLLQPAIWGPFPSFTFGRSPVSSCVSVVLIRFLWTRNLYTEVHS